MNGVEKKKPRTWLTAFLGTVILFILGLSALWFSKSKLNMQQDAVLIAILLVPALLYLILSGKLQELSGGGLSLRFNAVALTNLDESLQRADPLDVNGVDCLADVYINPNCIKELQKNLQLVSKSKYIVMPVKLGGPVNPITKERGQYHTESLLGCLRECAKYPNFKFLAVLGQNEAVIAYTSGWKVIQILEQSLFLRKDQEVQKSVLNEYLSIWLEEELQNHGSVQESEFINALNKGQDEVLQNHGLVKKTLSTKDTNITALKVMTELKMDALIVTDGEHKLIGIVDREQVLSKLMLAFNKPS